MVTRGEEKMQTMKYKLETISLLTHIPELCLIIALLN